jgi:hypothetical protein
MDFTIEEVARRVAAGHAFDDHVVQEKQFEDPTRGPVVAIETREQLQEHIERVLKDQATECFVALPSEAWRQADIFYHQPTNTIVIVPAKPEQEATAFRPDKGHEYFTKRVYETVAMEEKQTIEQCRGTPELRQMIEEQRTVAREEDRLRKIVEGRLDREKKDREQGKGRSR